MGGRVGQVGFHGNSPAARGADLVGHGPGVVPAVITVGLWRARIRRIVNPQEGTQHCAATLPERQRGGGH